MLNRAQVDIIDIHYACLGEHWGLLRESLLPPVLGFEQGLNPPTAYSTGSEFPRPTPLPDGHEVLLLEAFHLQKQFTDYVVVHWLLLMWRLVN